MTKNQQSIKDVMITRVFKASVEDVWNMWTDADNFKKWYGPEGASIPTAEMNVQVGGKRLVCMEMNTSNMQGSCRWPVTRHNASYISIGSFPQS